MRKRFAVLSILFGFVALSTVSCGGGADNPAAPAAGSSASAALPDEGGDQDVDLSSGGEVGASAVSIIRWTVRDSCQDGRGIRFRFFAMRAGRQTGLLKVGNGRSKRYGILCTTGDKICIGGEQNPPGGLEFGIGPNGNGKQTAAACKACLSGRNYTTNVTCKKGSLTGEPFDELADEDALDFEE